MATSREKAAVLNRLESETGRLSPAAVVAEARDPGSPLHGDFEWNDGEAAEKYRLMQAAKLIRTVRLEVTVNSIPLSAPAYIRDLSGETKGYRNILQVRDETDLARAAVIDAMQRVSNAIRRARTLAAVLGVGGEVGQIDELAAGIIARVNLADRPHGEA